MVDEGGWRAAKEVFSSLPIERLFTNFNIHQQAEAYWRMDVGLPMLLDGLPTALGYWDDSSHDETEGE